ncbi:MAG: DUF1702 family protein [FCB group bacterium]|nr:DUF1702 family protein [FCB group bacterium]
MPSFGPIRKKFFGISEEETTCRKRGFTITDPVKGERLETIGKTFVKGYHAALWCSSPDALYGELEKESPELRGFIYEGAGMGLALLDYFTPWNRHRHARFLRQYGSPHIYMLHVGYGWALARTPWRISRRIDRLDPLLRWLAFDGYGFHQGYFKWPAYIAKQKEPREIHDYGRRAFDQGLGRSLWFVGGADVPNVIKLLKKFPAGRQGDLWSGIGLACTYAGGADPAELAALIDHAGEYYPMLAKGSVFAAKARQRAGIVSQETETVTQIICKQTTEKAAALSDESLQDLPDDGTEPAWEIWRRRIQSHFGS